MFADEEEVEDKANAENKRRKEDGRSKCAALWLIATQRFVEAAAMIAGDEAHEAIEEDGDRC